MDCRWLYEKKEDLTLTVSFTNTEIFINVVNIIKEVIEDERIDEDIRLEYGNKILNLVK